jgi:hypothetical protein
VQENKPPLDLDAETPNVPQGHDYEYDLAHEMPAGPPGVTPAPHGVAPPPQVHFGQDGDYGYDEAHDFGASRTTKT